MHRYMKTLPSAENCRLFEQIRPTCSSEEPDTASTSGAIDYTVNANIRQVLRLSCQANGTWVGMMVWFKFQQVVAEKLLALQAALPPVTRAAAFEIMKYVLVGTK
jgi:hypothetical protein